MIRTHLQMPIHNPTPPKIRLKEVHHTQLRPRRDIHDVLLVLDLSIVPRPRLAHPLGPLHFVVELLHALFAQG